MNLFQRTLKKIIFSKLKNLKYGQLRIEDPQGVIVLGNQQYPLVGEIRVLDPSFYAEIFTGGSIGAAQAFVSKKWDSPDLDSLMALFAVNRTVLSHLDSGYTNFKKPLEILGHWARRNTLGEAKRNIKAHYDLPDELFHIFLDSSRMYSCAIYPDKDSSLEEAQVNKMRTIAEKLKITPGCKILEIGGGWGALAIFLAQNYDCHVTTTTISENQYEETKKWIKQNGLEKKITLLKKDYRQLTGLYDRVVSVEMIEAVGHQFLGVYLKKISHLLKEDGLLVLQAITMVDREYDRAVREVDFIKKYIFPGSFIPSLFSIHQLIKKRTDLQLISQRDFSHHYSLTLKDWKKRFNNGQDRLKKAGVGEDFMRMWNFYFSYCIGGFTQKAIGVSQLVYCKPMFREV